MVARKQTKKRTAAPNRKKKPQPKPESESEEASCSSEDEPAVAQKQTLTKRGATHANDSSCSDDEENGSSESVNKQSESDQSESEADDDNKGKLFSDKNSSWLKLKEKSGLLDDDSDEQERDEESAEDEESEEENKLDIEKEADMIDEEMEAERLEAEEEMRHTIREHTAVYHLPTSGELEKDVDRVVPPSEVRSHIDSIMEVLAEFKTRREPGRSRKDYIDQLGLFIAELYGYLPDLIDYFLTMFSPAECLEFVDSSDQPRPMVIRTNTLKTRRKDLAASLMKRGVTLDPLAAWSKVGLKIVESPVPVGATPEYLSGQYMLQSAASMCPVLALAPEPKERVLDVSAAPGGKTSYIAQLMRNTGVVLANDVKAERQKATVANMHRLGVKNVIACKHDGRKLGSLFKNRFDRILLDAPCSGLGVISRDPSVKIQRTIADINQCAHLQKELLLAAIDALKFKNTTGGVMVYSTCSVSVAENEEVINYALTKRDIKVIGAGLDFGKPGFTRYQEKRFHPSVALTRRFYPHVHNMDGFFVAKIQKLSDKRPGETTVDGSEEQQDSVIKSDEKQKTVSDTKKNTGKGKKVISKKRKLPDEADASKQVTSIPPTRHKQKKQKTDAKMTKPRRHRAAQDA
jgi:ribosomal RNA methyltransferase Nop2